MLDLLPMRDDITVFKGEEYDMWGDPVPSDPEELKGNYRYNTSRETIVNDNGDEIVYSADVYLPYDTDVSFDSTIMFKDDLGNTIRRKPLSLQHKRDIWGSPMVLRVVV